MNFLRLNGCFREAPARSASSLAEQPVLCFCQCPQPLFTKHGICLAYGSSVGSSRQACSHWLPSATQSPSKRCISFPRFFLSLVVLHTIPFFSLPLLELFLPQKSASNHHNTHPPYLMCHLFPPDENHWFPLPCAVR